MFSTHLNALVAHGRALEEIVEPALPAGMLDAEPMPMFLAGRCRKTG